ncbi:MAG: S8 family serine peptidase [Candidatus Sifarchaeia archaeon]|jgi:subtilisin family serine protease
MKRKYIDNWFSGLRYKFSEFGIKKYSVVESQESKTSENWIVKHGNFDKTNFDGEGEKVAVLDTGVDPDHAEIKGKVTPMCFIKNCQDPIRHFDYSNHGTFIIGEIISNNLGIAPKAECLSAKVLYGDGRDGDLHKFEKDLVSAIQFACYNGCGVISMSFGSPHKSKIVEEALEMAVSLGIIPVAASGNEGMRGSPYKSYPASFDNCISVASANEHDLPSWFSTSGKGDKRLEQPEVAIASLNYHHGILTHDRYGRMMGTSISCPIVAGLALLWRQARKDSMPRGKNVLKEFREWLYKHAEDTNMNGWDNELGFGVLKLEPWEFL